MQFVPPPPRLPGPLGPRASSPASFGNATPAGKYGDGIVPELPSPPKPQVSQAPTPGLADFMGQLFGQAPAVPGAQPPVGTAPKVPGTVSEAAIPGVAPASKPFIPFQMPRTSTIPDWLRNGSAVGGGLPLDPRIQLQSMLADASRSEIPVTSAEDAARDFAGILFGYMFSEMRPKGEEGGLMGGGDSEMFMDFFDQAVGRHFADGAGGSLVEALVKQLSKADQK